MLQREQIMRGKEHWPPKCVVRLPFSLFTCQSTTQQRLVTSPRDPGVVSLHVNAGHFSTTARRVTSPTWGPPPPCKQALSLGLIRLVFTEIQRFTVFPVKPWTPEKISGMFIVSRPIRCEIKPQKITDKPQNGLITTWHETTSSLFLPRVIFNFAVFKYWSFSFSTAALSWPKNRYKRHFTKSEVHQEDRMRHS